MTNQVPYFRLLQAITSEPWAMTEPMLALIVDRVLYHSETDIKALETILGRPLENTGNRVTTRGRTAVFGIEGPIFRYANLFTALSGATSIELLARDLQTAISDPKIERAVLNINSPGGEVDGMNAMADFIRQANDVKPVYAYIDGTAASAAYWLASATRGIVAEEAARVGSIGIIATALDNTAAQERQGVKRYTIVSSQSPKKGLSVSTDAGRAQLQALVDSAAELFISKVARFRGVDPKAVQENFGQGFIVPTGEALNAGMIDQVSPFESFLSGFDRDPAFTIVRTPAALAAPEKEKPMAETQQPAAPAPQPAAPPNPTPPAAAPAPAAALQPAAPPAPPPLPQGPTAQEAATTERKRVQTILNSPEAQGRESLARFLAFERPELDADSAIMVLKAAPKEQSSNPLERAMAHVPNPKVGVSATEVEGTAAEEAQRILAFVPKDRKVTRAA